MYSEELKISKFCYAKYKSKAAIPELLYQRCQSDTSFLSSNFNMDMDDDNAPNADSNKLEIIELDEAIRRQRKLETRKRYRLKNREKIKETKRARYAANREQERAKYAANKDKAKARYQANKDIIKERRRARYAANKEKTVTINGNIVKLNGKIMMWMPVNETALINFLKENVEFEKPTPQVFYKRFIESSGVKADWKIVRSKVLNMRTTYNKTNEWLNTVGEAMADDESVGNAIRNMCPFYYDFEKIFESNFLNSSTNSDTFPPSIVKSESISDQNFDDASSTLVKTENEEFENVYDNMPSTSQDRSFSVTETMSSHAENHHNKDIPANDHTANCSGAYFGTAVSEMVQSHAESLKLKRKKMDIDSHFREKEMRLLERQVAVQEKQMEFKEMELKSQEHLKMLELEMKERIAMKELELKYNNK